MDRGAGTRRVLPQAIAGTSTSEKLPRNQVKPVATISQPMRLSGRLQAAMSRS